MISPTVTDIETAAFAAYAAGLSVLPPREDGTKAPLAEGGSWKEFQATRASFSLVSRWYSTPRHGLGVVCGSVSGGREGVSLNALDFDDGPTYRRFVELAEATGLGNLLSRVFAGYSEATPKGGRHILARAPGSWPTTKLAERPDPDRAGGRITLIETKCEGGYLVLAPSFGPVHPSGLPYQILSGDFASIGEISGPEWKALCDLAASLDEMPPREPVKPSPGGPALGSAGPAPGEQWAAETTWEDLLSRHGWTKVFSRGETAYWRRPGKGWGISATVNHGGSDLFYCFSSSTPFEPRQSYTKFGVLACLEYGGDYHIAAQALFHQGYGSGPRSNGKCSESPPTRETRLTRKGGGPGGAFRVNRVSRVGGLLEDEPPIEVREWPQPPEIAVYHGLAGQFVQTMAPHTESDPVAILVQLLIGFGNLIGRTAFFLHEADQHFANLFVSLVGPSAKARKGTSWGRVLRILRSVDPEWAEKRVLSGLSSGEGLIWAVRDPICKREPIKEKGRVTAYQEVEVDGGVSDKRLLALETELASPLQALVREGNNLSAILRRAWDDGSLRTLTKNSPAVATAAHVSLIGHVTVYEIQRLLSSIEVANGFGNRFLWVCVRRSQYLPFGGTDHKLDWAPLFGRLGAVAAAARTRGRVVRSESADRLWGEVYRRLSDAQPGLLGAILGRAEAQVMRLALIYALLDESPEIDLPHLEAALALWHYAEASARYIFGDALGDPDGDLLIGALRSTPLGLTRNAIREEVFQKNKPSAEIARILGRLLGYGLVRSEKIETGGRPAETWFAV